MLRSEKQLIPTLLPCANGGLSAQTRLASKMALPLLLLFQTPTSHRKGGTILSQTEALSELLPDSQTERWALDGSPPHGQKQSSVHLCFCSVVAFCWFFPSRF